MQFLEKDLEQIISGTSLESLRSRGLNIAGKIYRQKKIGSYGIADLISVYRIPGSDTINITVFELKNKFITTESFMQASRYIRGIRHFLELRKCKIKFVFKICLVGRSIAHNDPICFLPATLPANYLNFIIYSFKEDGIQFTKSPSFEILNHKLTA